MSLILMVGGGVSGKLGDFIFNLENNIDINRFSTFKGMFECC